MRNQKVMKRQSQKMSVHPRTRGVSERCCSSSSSAPRQQDIFLACYVLCGSIALRNKTVSTSENESVGVCGGEKRRGKDICACNNKRRRRRFAMDCRYIYFSLFLSRRRRCLHAHTDQHRGTPAIYVVPCSLVYIHIFERLNRMLSFFFEIYIEANFEGNLVGFER